MSQLITPSAVEKSATVQKDLSRSRTKLIEDFKRVRSQTESLCSSLEVEDFVVQSMPDASPTKWHLAHTSWFYETFILKPFASGYTSENPIYEYLFNSYYNLIGDRWARPERGMLSRPTVRDVFEYRKSIDAAIQLLIMNADEASIEDIGALLTLGMNHEQQHQELLLTDIKHVFAQNPMHPVYAKAKVGASAADGGLENSWISIDEGLYEIGHAGSGFAFDNESPRHRVYLDDFQLATQLVTNEQFMDFMNDRGYQRPELWLSDGWNEVQTHGWNAPLYWKFQDGAWWNFTLSGFRPVDPKEPVTHVSYYEAAAFAEWSGARLPREEEWEVASNLVPISGSFVESGHFHPAASQERSASTLAQMYGEVWQWTESSYSPYPGFKAPEGALGEYNGKFMINQMVLRGASCATPRSHIRNTYRNFFPPSARWQFSGIRLAKSESRGSVSGRNAA